MSDPTVESSLHFKIRVGLYILAIFVLLTGCSALVTLPLGLPLSTFDTVLFVLGAITAVIGVVISRSRTETLAPSENRLSDMLPMVMLLGGGAAIVLSIVIGLSL